MVSRRARREQVRFLGQRGVSQRRACGLLGVPRSTLVYRLRQPEKDARPIDAMQRLSSQYPLRLSPHPHLPATRGTDDEHQPGAALVAPSWPHLAAQTAPSHPRQQPAAASAAARAANRVWAYDFLFDSCAAGEQLKCLTVVDEFTHECLATDVAGSIRSKRVIEILAG